MLKIFLEPVILACDLPVQNLQIQLHFVLQFDYLDQKVVEQIPEEVGDYVPRLPPEQNQGLDEVLQTLLQVNIEILLHLIVSLFQNGRELALRVQQIDVTPVVQNLHFLD